MDFGGILKDDDAARSPKPRELTVAFQQVIALPAARERVFCECVNTAKR